MNRRRGWGLYIVASFEQSLHIELAIVSLESIGIESNRILAVPLDSHKKERVVFDTIHRSDGFSLFDIAAILGTCFMLLGAIYGMVLPLGPVLGGLIGLIIGLVSGFLIKYLLVRKYNIKFISEQAPTEVFLLIHCTVAEKSKIEEILWKHTAHGIGTVEL